MDIVITLPKTEDWEVWLMECRAVAEDPAARLNYCIGKRPLPKKAKPGDRCYILHQGLILGYHTIDKLCHRKGFFCETTGRYWPEGNYIIRAGKFHPVNPIRMRGFQGYRYFKPGVQRVSMPVLPA